MPATALCWNFHAEKEERRITVTFLDDLCNIIYDVSTETNRKTGQHKVKKAATNPRSCYQTKHSTCHVLPHQHMAGRETNLHTTGMAQLISTQHGAGQRNRTQDRNWYIWGRK